MNKDQNSILPMLEHYKNDEDVQETINKELELLNKQNLATRAEFSNTLVVSNTELKAFGNDLLYAVGKLDIELEEKTNENENLKTENTFLKNTLNENNIVYEDGLKNLINNNNNSLILKTEDSIKQRGLKRLLSAAKKNRKL